MTKIKEKPYNTHMAESRTEKKRVRKVHAYEFYLTVHTTYSLQEIFSTTSDKVGKLMKDGSIENSNTNFRQIDVRAKKVKHSANPQNHNYHYKRNLSSPSVGRSIFCTLM